MQISVLGCGRWGAFLAWYAAACGQRVMLWGRGESAGFRELAETRRNQYLALPDSVTLTTDLPAAIAGAGIVLIAISAQGLRGLCRQLAALPHGETIFVLCMKGLEVPTGQRLTQVFREEMGQAVPLAVWLGPGHVQEFVRGAPNCMVIDSDDPRVITVVVERLGGWLIRFYYGQDLIGNEIGAAAKNVIGIAAGMLDGLGLSSLKGALMARGAREVARLVRALGGSELTVYGLSHLGDYEATLFSPHSHNRRFGEAFVGGTPFTQLAEGVPTARALSSLAVQLEVGLPICNSVNAIIEENLDPRTALEELFLRPRTFQFDIPEAST